MDRHCDAGALRLVAVVTQPDRIGHRGALATPPVKRRAHDFAVPVLQPERLAGTGLAEVLAFRPQLLVWAAYGQLIPGALLAAVDGRALNVHASLLPRWRGAAPIQRAILAGDGESGVTLMEGTAELDAGPILAQERAAINPVESAGELTARLATLGGRLLERWLPGYIAGDLRGHEQDANAVTWAPKMHAREGELDFARPAEELARRVRAFTPEPGAFTSFRGQRVVVLRASATSGSPSLPGTLAVRDGAPHVAASAGWLRLDLVKPAGRRAMDGAAWARGLRDLAPDGRLPS